MVGAFACSCRGLFHWKKITLGANNDGYWNAVNKNHAMKNFGGISDSSNARISKAIDETRKGIQNSRLFGKDPSITLKECFIPTVNGHLGARHFN